MMHIPTSPFAPTMLPYMAMIDGVQIATAQTGMKYKDRYDVLLMRFVEGTAVAGVFTRSATAASPVRWCQTHMHTGTTGGLIVNAGNANAFTGVQGDNITQAMAQAAAEKIGCDASDVMVASTGVIGEPFDPVSITAHIPAVEWADDNDAWHRAATAITTTDTYIKLATSTAMIDGVEVHINGIAKGSGMIAPNMATMLSFIATDAAISSDILQEIIAECNARSFNSITVDGDSSTNDTVLLFATGKASNTLYENAEEPALQPFKQALQSLMIDLAQQIVKDGEGAKKYIAINVKGARDYDAAHRIAMCVANSTITKAAIAGADPNWGRIVMALGNAGEAIDIANTSIAIGSYPIAKNGAVIPNYDETAVAAYMKQANIDITAEVGAGQGEATVWTCDLTHGYIDINADYRS